MYATSTYVHALEGRLRIKIPQAKGSPARALEIERHLMSSTGIENVSANPTTGNVLILYNPCLLQQEDIFSALEELGYLDAARLTRIPHPSGQSGVFEKVTTSMAATLMEVALARLVGALS